MIWTRMLAYITGTVDQELLLSFIKTIRGKENDVGSVRDLHLALDQSGVTTTPSEWNYINKDGAARRPKMRVSLRVEPAGLGCHP
jgi:hypothetical protein